MRPWNYTMKRAIFPLYLRPWSIDISHLLYYLFANLIDDSKEELKQNSQKLLQQSRINESIQRYKAENISTASYPYERKRTSSQR